VYYFQHYQDDKPSSKLMVAVVWFLDVLHTITVFTSDWLWLIEHFGEVGISNWIPWSLGVTVVLTAMVTIIVHGFFIFRIHGLSRGNWFVVGPILVLAVVRLGFASTTCAKMLVYADFGTFVDNVAWVFTMGLVTSSILDVVITLCLLWYLGNAKTGFAGMDQIVNCLSLYAIENGLITSVAIVISLGCWLGMRHNLIFMAIHFVVAKLYANSLLATLNSRKNIRERNRATSFSEGPQSMAVFNIRRATAIKISTDHAGTSRSHGEKSPIRHSDEAHIVLSPIKSQAETEKDSLETATTSNTIVGSPTTR
jgi:hypothetical protein